MTWNPTAELVEERRELECSRDDDTGKARAVAYYRKWSANERIAYEDSVTTQLLDDDVKGEQTIRLGTMQLVHLALTLTRVEGFPDMVTIDDVDYETVPDRDGPKGATKVIERPVRRSVSFNPRDRRCLRAITDEATYAELVKHALEIQPMPTSEDAAGAEDAAQPEPGSGEDGPTLPGGDDDADPSRTRPTPPAATRKPRKAPSTRTRG